MGSVSAPEPIAPNASPTPKWSDKPLLKSWEKSKPPLGWPRSTDSLCPEVRAGNSPADSRRPSAGRRSDERKSRRDQGPDRRTRRQDLDGQGLRQARSLRRPDVDRHRILEAPGRRFPRPRHSRPQRRETASPRFVHGEVWPRRRADRRSHQPLQHDVRSLLHGREPGWVTSTN